MNEQLMKVVERAVRPVRAGRVRKLQMREELLAHLSAIYDEEFLRQSDETAAYSAAILRFGDPAELSRELAQSVGWAGQWAQRQEQFVAAVDRTFGWQAGEPLWRYLARSGLWIVGLVAALALLMIGVVSLSGERLDSTFASFNIFTLVLFGHMAVSICAFLWAIQTTYRTLYQPRRLLLAALQLAGWILLFVLLGSLFWLGLTRSLASLGERLPRMVTFTALFLPPLLMVIAWGTQRAVLAGRRHERWTKLELDEV